MKTHWRSIKNIQRLEHGTYQVLQHFLGRSRINKILGKRKKAFYKNLLKTLQQNGEGNVTEIERRTNLSIEEFRNHYLKKGIPVVMEGAAKDWPCVKKWSFDYIKELHGDDEVLLFEEKNKKAFHVKRLREILETINSGGREYLKQYRMLNQHPEHIADLDTTWLNKYKEKKAAWFPGYDMFIGSMSTQTKLHMESKCNMFIQIHGEKKWILFHPRYSAVMEPPPIKGAYRGSKLVAENIPFDLFNPEYNELSEAYRFLDRYETTIRPGDILWMPSFYWHTVKNLTSGIGIAYRWFNPVSVFKMAPLYAVLDCFQIKQPLWKSLKQTQNDTNKVILSKHGILKEYLEEKAAKEQSQRANPS